ncbi:hypothetical protein EJP82_20830 [Paenibacillus anaericanus]|uniref:20S proteasome subunit A/B n=1 Tax=Paenibacillus anaericanus TaxID=170367 RepID=A0A3S1BMY8_9BACL|nr:hypothetical protein [Paenibacillus anaericanus]RUT43263.1 hypothetical protein EJP82_20830 [Paenibacillus anaericanus]
MSLCIVANNPYMKYLVIASDGRITKYGEVAGDDFKKLTLINEHVSIFTSGIVTCAEELRTVVTSKSKDKNIDEIAMIAQEESIRINNDFHFKYPNYFEGNNRTDMATIIGFFDIHRNESGYIKLCRSDGYTPHKIIDSSVQTSGYSQDLAMSYFLDHFNGSEPCEPMYDAFKYVSESDNSVGGVMKMHVISNQGTSIYQAVI